MFDMPFVQESRNGNTELWPRVPLPVCDDQSQRTEDAKLCSLHPIYHIVSKELFYLKQRFRFYFRFEPSGNPGRSRQMKHRFPEDWIGPFPKKKTKAEEIVSRIPDFTGIRSRILVQEMEIMTAGGPELVSEAIRRSARGRIPNQRYSSGKGSKRKNVIIDSDIVLKS